MDLKVMEVFSFTFYTLVQSFINLAGDRTCMLLCRGGGMRIIFKTPFSFSFHHWILRTECRLQGLLPGIAILSYHKVVVALRVCFSKATEKLPVSMEQEMQKEYCPSSFISIHRMLPSHLSVMMPSFKILKQWSCLGLNLHLPKWCNLFSLWSSQL